MITGEEARVLRDGVQDFFLRALKWSGGFLPSSFASTQSGAELPEPVPGLLLL
jgi:hypothetical protein